MRDFFMVLSAILATFLVTVHLCYRTYTQDAINQCAENNHIHLAGNMYSCQKQNKDDIK